ncbi:transmembrane protein 265-like [Vanacampus margaritifer]
MSDFDSPHTCIKVGEDEDMPLNTVPGSGETRKGLMLPTKKNGTGAVACCGGDMHHRKLAIISIICGISCVGIKALIYSVKAEKETDREASARFLRRAKRLAIISIATWLTILALIPLLMALFSYVVTLKD